MKNIKVVYNTCYGGFGLSKAAAIKLAALGVKELQEQLSDKSLGNRGSYYIHDLQRHDPRLIAVVEELGEKANGQFAKLQIAVLSGNKYRIDEYDGGNESVEEPMTVQDEWVTVNE